MLFRAAFIYGLAVAIVLLGVVIVWQRAAISSLGADATLAESTAADLRKQLDNAREASSTAARELRLSQQALDDMQRARETAERAASAVRAELDRHHSAMQAAAGLNKSAADEAARLKTELETAAQAIAAMQASLAAARAEAEAAKTEIDMVRRQMPMAAAGAAAKPETTGALDPAAATGTAGASSNADQKPNGRAATIGNLEPQSSIDSKIDSIGVTPKAGPRIGTRNFAGRRPQRRRLPLLIAPDSESQTGLPF